VCERYREANKLQQREGKENMRVKREDSDGVLMNNGFEEQWRLKFLPI